MHGQGEHSTVTSTNEDSPAGVATTGFTAEQVQRILSVIETPTSIHGELSGKEIWLLDSGASYYMTNMLSLLCEVEDIRPIHVALPNGSEILAVKRGTVYLGSNLRLNNVLFFPD